MSFLLWQRDRDVAIGSTRLVLRAAEVPLFNDALDLRARLERMNDDKVRYIVAQGDAASAQARAQGLEEGRRAAREEFAAALANMAQASAHEHARVRGEIAALALEVVRKLMGALADDERLVALADTAARELLPSPALTLAVHPDQVDAVRARLAAGSQNEVAALRLEVRADPACERDACRIETEHGSIDASVAAQLDRLATAWGVPVQPRAPDAAADAVAHATAETAADALANTRAQQG